MPNNNDRLTPDDDPAVLQLAADFRALYIIGNHDPALYYPVAELLREEMAERGWDIPAFCHAASLGFSDVVEELMQGVRITRRTAEHLAEAFGTSALVWKRLDKRTRQEAR